MTGTYTPSGLKNKTVNQVHRHHHQGQNRPHQKTITYPQSPAGACDAKQQASRWEWGPHRAPTPPSQPQRRTSHRALALRPV